jgi:hypothetical protein
MQPCSCSPSGTGYERQRCATYAGWDQVDFNGAVLHVRRAKNGTPSTHPLTGRLPNKALRTREHLTETEVERLIKAAGDNRNGHRDATMLLLAFRHGLRASEVCELRCGDAGASRWRRRSARISRSGGL